MSPGADAAGRNMILVVDDERDNRELLEVILAWEGFRVVAAPGGEDSLIVHILHRHEAADWPAAREAATLWAFTRFTALAWAPGLEPAIGGEKS